MRARREKEIEEGNRRSCRGKRKNVDFVTPSTAVVWDWTSPDTIDPCKDRIKERIEDGSAVAAMSNRGESNCESGQALLFRGERHSNRFCFRKGCKIEWGKK